MKKSQFLIAFLLLFMFGCQRGCSRISRNFQASERNYIILMYSGGKIVYSDTCKTIVNDVENSDGCYYYNKDGKLVEISGDYVLISK